MSDKIINIYEIKAKFSSYARSVMKGKSYVISFRNIPFAELRPLDKNKNKSELKFGVIKGQIKLAGDFNAPLPEFEKDFYGE